MIRQGDREPFHAVHNDWSITAYAQYWRDILNGITYIYCTLSYKSEHFTWKGSLDVESKISEHDQNKKDVIEDTSCKNAFVHRCLGAAEVFFHMYRHDHFFTLTLDELNTIEKTLVYNTVKGLK